MTVGHRSSTAGNLRNCTIVLKIYECCPVRSLKAPFKNLCLVRTKEEGILSFLKETTNMNVLINDIKMDMKLKVQKVNNITFPRPT